MSIEVPVAKSPLSAPAMLVLVAALVALEGYDLACYGATVPVLLADTSMGADPAGVAGAGSLLAVGMMAGAAMAGLGTGIRRATMLFWVMSFCGLLLVFGISTWLPTIMKLNGYSLGSALLQAAAMWAGAGAGMVAGGRLADALGAKPVVAVAFGVGSLSLLAMSLRPSTALLFVLMFVSGLGLIGSQVLVNAFMATHYSDGLRGPGLGWALSVGRLGAILGPAWDAGSGLGRVADLGRDRLRGLEQLRADRAQDRGGRLPLGQQDHHRQRQRPLGGEDGGGQRGHAGQHRIGGDREAVAAHVVLDPGKVLAAGLLPTVRLVGLQDRLGQRLRQVGEEYLTG